MFYSNGAYSLFKVDTPVISGGATPPSFQDIYSYQFDGVDDYIDTNSIYSELNGTTKATWSLWVKPTLGSTGVLSRVSSTTSTSAFVYQFYISSIGEVVMQIGDTTRRARTGSNVLTDNVWSHILVFYDGTLSNGSKTKIFINGVDSTSSDSTTATSLVNANYPLSIGRRDQTPTYYYDGFIDELAMWNSTDFRNQSDVDTIYNGGIPTNLNDNGLTAPTTWFRMGESANWDGSNWTLTDQGSGGNDATSQNMAEASRVLDVPPNPWTNTKSILLDGVDDYVNIGTSSLGITSAISVSAWVKIPTTNTGGGGTNIQVIACEDTTSGGQRNWNMFWRGMGSNYFAWVIHHTNLSISSVTTTGITPNDGQWHHILATYDGTTNANGIKLYVDGVLNVQGTAGSTGLNAFSSTESTIGATTGGGAWRFEGNIDEVAVWNSDRNADASTIYNGGVPNNLNDLSNAPLSWWRCGDGDTSPTLTDNGSGGNDGTMQNFTTFSTDVPKFNNKSILLDGVDDWVSVLNNNTIARTQNLSYSIWVKLVDGATRQYLVGNWTSSNGGTGLSIETSNTLVFQLGDGTNDSYFNSRVTNFTTYAPNNTWNHVLATWDGNNAKIYINGILRNTWTPTSLTISNWSTFWIGRRSANGNDTTYGNLDEVSIFNNDQSANVSSIFNQGVPNDISSINGLVSWWRFEGSGTTAIDSGGGNNDGTLINGVTRSTNVPT